GLISQKNLCTRVFPVYRGWICISLLQINFTCCIAVDHIVCLGLFRLQIDLNIFHIADFLLQNLCPDLFHFLKDLFICVLFSVELKVHLCLQLSFLGRSLLSRSFLGSCLLSRSFLLSRLLFRCIYQNACFCLDLLCCILLCLDCLCSRCLFFLCLIFCRCCSLHLCSLYCLFFLSSRLC